ncbi:MAG: DNA translocase FtsK [Candidatus Cloacimonetes bacterium]|nr:DNA translocase FtsK [Candidatus Cloacimonadota bacterium]
MAGKSRKKTSSKRTPGLKPWQKRLIAGGLTLLALLVMISLLFGLESLQGDKDYLSLKGNVFRWPFVADAQVDNPIGVFGVAVGWGLCYFFGYYFSLIGAILIGIISFLYFLDPGSQRSRQKSWLLLTAAFLLQVWLAGKLVAPGHTVVPRAIWAGLEAVFSTFGAALLLWLGMALALILFFEYRRLKVFFANLWRELTKQRGSEPAKEKPAQPTITTEIQPGPQPAPQPVIQNHSQSGGGDFPALNQSEPAAGGKAGGKEKKRPPDPESISDGEREYVMPSIADFLESPVKLSERDRKEIENQILGTSQVLKSKLAEFGIEAEVRNVNIGPIITQYELEPAKGVKVNKFTSLADDLALAIKAKSIRVQAPIPGRGLIGIEIPNLTRDMIYLRDLLLSEEIRSLNSKLVFGLGKDIAGHPVVTDLARMPHLLIAGATGSGKSVCINAIIMSFILRTKPEDLRLILIDPKRVELAGYNGLPHLIGSVVTDPEQALENMYWAVREMEHRYELLQEARVRDIGSFNEKAEQDREAEKLPYIVIIVDEFADLILTSGKDIEVPITRLAQMARAVGIHLILATQRPSIKVITGMIKANFSARIAFQVSSRVDSRVILDQIGAERLLGNGDMLFLPPGKALTERIHGSFVSDHEIARVCEFLAMQPKPQQDFSIVKEDGGDMGYFEYDDELFPEAARVVVNANTASVSMLQRHFRIGYARAGRLIDLLERARIIGPHLGSKSRDVLASSEDLVQRGILREER